MFIRFVLVFAFLWLTPIYPQQQTLSRDKLSNNYAPYFLRLLQIIYGDERILSQGGAESVDLMFAPVHLSNQKILDVGSGFGGVDLHLAKRFPVTIVGVDREPYMVKMAEGFLAKAYSSLVGQVTFQTLQDPIHLSEFEDNTFDMAFSKETFYNVPREDKLIYLQEVYRTLKPGALFIVADWFQRYPHGGEYLRLASTDKKICQFVTPEAFQQLLETAHFQIMAYVDQCQEHIQYTKEESQRLVENRELICNELDEDTYHKTAIACKYWLEAQEMGELISGIFYVVKPVR